MKDKAIWYYCKSLGSKVFTEKHRFKKYYCKKGFDKCEQFDISKCNDFKYSWWKSVRRFFYLRRVWLEKFYEIYLVRIRYKGLRKCGKCEKMCEV